MELLEVLKSTELFVLLHVLLNNIMNLASLVLVVWLIFLIRKTSTVPKLPPMTGGSPDWLEEDTGNLKKIRELTNRRS